MLTRYTETPTSFEAARHVVWEETADEASTSRSVSGTDEGPWRARTGRDEVATKSSTCSDCDDGGSLTTEPTSWPDVVEPSPA